MYMVPQRPPVTKNMRTEDELTCSLSILILRTSSRLDPRMVRCLKTSALCTDN
jgi:hypothetical protein